MWFGRIGTIFAIILIYFFLNLTMYCLVQFVEDKVWHVCRRSAVRGKFAKWLDGHRYQAEIIARSNEYEILTGICKNLSNEVPVVLLERIDTISCRKQLFNEQSNEIGLEVETFLYDNVSEKFNILEIIHEKGSKPKISPKVNIISDLKLKGRDKDSPVLEKTDSLPDAPVIDKRFSEYNESVELYATDASDPFETDGDSSYVPSEEISDDSIQDETGRKGSLALKNTDDLPVPIEDELFYRNENNTPKWKEHDFKNDGNMDRKNEDVSMQGSTNSHRKSKQHCCFICMRLVTKLPKHLELHEDNDEVIKALSLPKGSTERRKFLYEIQKKGDFKYNSQNENNIISVRKGETKNLMPCPYCKGYYSKKNLRNHIRLKCRPQKKNVNSIVLSRALQPRVLDIANDLLKQQVLPKLRDDDISEIIRNDRLIITCGNTWCIKYSSSSHHQKMIRSRLRHLAKILQTLKKYTDRVTDFSSIFHPSNFDDVVKTVQEIAGLNSRRGEYKAPGSATNSCTLLLQSAEMSKFEAIKAGDEEKEKNTNRFIFLLEKSMNPLITKMAIENRTQRQRQKVITLPKTEDIQKIFFLACNKIKECLKKLGIAFEEENWVTLAKNLLVAIMIFNRKRPGEIERAQLLDYKNCEIVDDESKVGLEGEQQALAKVFGRFTIRGKLNRTVPVVVSELMRMGIDTLLKFRSQAGISQDNKYIFARKCNTGETDAFFSAHLALEEIKCKVPDAKDINATSLRKHLATVSSTLNLNEDNVNKVASFLGHHTSIHKQIYVQRPIISDVVAVTPILNEALGVGNDEAHVFENNGNSNLSTIFENSLESEDIQVADTPVLNEAICVNNDKAHVFENYATSKSSIMFKKSFQSEGVPKYKRKAESVEDGEELCNSRKIRNLSRRPPRRTWTTPEKQIMKKIFRDEILNKEVPTLPECTQVLMDHESLRTRTPKQIQLWVLSETKRSAAAAQGESQNRWTTPERRACRTYFKNFYKTHKYPEKEDLEQAIATIPELHNRTPKRLKSHLQHDLKYISRCCT